MEAKRHADDRDRNTSRRGQKKRNLGIGLELKAGEIELDCRKAGQPVKAHVQIKKQDARVVHQGDATLDRLVLG